MWVAIKAGFCVRQTRTMRALENGYSACYKKERSKADRTWHKRGPRGMVANKEHGMRKQTGLGDRDSSQGVESLGWDRLPGESSAAYRAFSMYRDMGAKRSLTFVSRNLNPGRPISVSAVSQWSTKYRWKQRCWEFDYHEQQEVERQLSRERKAVRERQIRLAMSLQALGAQGLIELQKKIERGESLNMSVADILTMAKAGTRLVRSSLGEERDPAMTKIVVVLNDPGPGEPEPTPPETVN